jgi:hypothetical protein
MPDPCSGPQHLVLTAGRFPDVGVRPHAQAGRSGVLAGAGSTRDLPPSFCVFAGMGLPGCPQVGGRCFDRRGVISNMRCNRENWDKLIDPGLLRMMLCPNAWSRPKPGS